jgi:hypothetical protein
VSEIAVAIAGWGPYCLVERTPDMRAWENATALCGQTVLTCNLGGEPRPWEPYSDAVCGNCLAAHWSTSPHTARSAAKS